MTAPKLKSAKLKFKLNGLRTTCVRTLRTQQPERNTFDLPVMRSKLSS